VFNFHTKFDLAGVRDIDNRLRLLNRLAAASVNTSAQFAEDTSVNRITDRLNLSRQYVEDKFSIRRASPQRLVATVTAVDRPVQLRQYSARQEFGDNGRRAGVSVQVLRGGARKTVRDAFFGRLRNGTPAVMARVGPSRTPLRVLYAPSPGQMFKTIGPDISERTLRQLVDDAFRRTGGLFDARNANVGLAE
jgi:hypothetical protein